MYIPFNGEPRSYFEFPNHLIAEDLESGHAFLSLALPAALKAAIKAGPEDAEQMLGLRRFEAVDIPGPQSQGGKT